MLKNPEGFTRKDCFLKLIATNKDTHFCSQCLNDVLEKAGYALLERVMSLNDFLEFRDFLNAIKVRKKLKGETK